MSDLKPCPFCGGPAESQEDTDGRNIDAGPWSVGCYSETCAMDMVEVWGRDQHAAETKWNARALPSTPPLDRDPSDGRITMRVTIEQAELLLAAQGVGRPPVPLDREAVLAEGRRLGLLEAAKLCDAKHDTFAQDERGKGINRGAALCAEAIRAAITQERCTFTSAAGYRCTRAKHTGHDHGWSPAGEADWSATPSPPPATPCCGTCRGRKNQPGYNRCEVCNHLCPLPASAAPATEGVTFEVHEDPHTGEPLYVPAGPATGERGGRTAEDVELCCPLCGEQKLVIFMDGRVIVATPHEPTLCCRNCGQAWRVDLTPVGEPSEHLGEAGAATAPGGGGR